MSRRWFGMGFLLGLLAIAAWVLPFGWTEVEANPQSGKDKVAKAAKDDLNAIQAVIERNLDITNNPETANLSIEKRIELGKKNHRSDESYEGQDLPLYFATNSVPVIRGSEAYIKAAELEFEAYKRQGYKFDVQIDEMQIYQDGRLAIVLATPRGVISDSSGNGAIGAAPARWTIALEKGSDGEWYIFHEHLSFFSESGVSSSQALRNLEQSVVGKVGKGTVGE